MRNPIIGLVRDWYITCFNSAFFTTALVVFALLSCVSPDHGTITWIIESNKKDPPAWVRLPPYSFAAGSGSAYFVFVKRGFRDLRLGLRQAEGAAKLTSEYRLHTCLASNIVGIGRIEESHDWREAQTFLVKKIGPFQSLWSRVEDIYYEAVLSADGDTTYDIYILISYSGADFKAFLGGLHGDLQTKGFAVDPRGFVNSGGSEELCFAAEFKNP